MTNTTVHRRFSIFNEGLGKVIRFGAKNDEVINRRAWMRDELTSCNESSSRTIGRAVTQAINCAGGAYGG
ncbi:oxamate carbamoyltransferase subunit AllG family protein [Escherichia coli]|uniref:oxamate carbamoyltransferase subunit AllG family protein n=1 Tax=Escherichia coli TaxID=562 RepID=UPI0032AFAA0B